MLGLVGVMGLARPSNSATPTAPDNTTAPPLPVPASGSAPTATAAPDPTIVAPPLALTARPTVQMTTPPKTAPVARTNGSH